MASFAGWDDQAIVEELGNRLRRLRLNRDVSQQELAERSGLSTRTIRNIESGQNPSLESLIKVMRALGLVDRFDELLPPPVPSPMDMLRLEGRRRERASGSRRG